METKKEKSSKKSDLELKKFSIEMAVKLGPNYSIAKADEIFKYLKTGFFSKSTAVIKK